MITIGYSTRVSNPQLKEYLIKSCGHPKTEVIEKVTNGEKNLSEVYNEIINESSNDIIVLCHDDLYFDTKNWGQKLEKLFEKNPDYSIIGIAGTTEMPKSGMWWEDRSKMYGIVNHEHNGKKWESRYSDSLQNNIKEVVGFIFQITDKVLWNTFRKNEIGDVLLPFVVIRRLDCILDPVNGKVRAAYENFKDKVDRKSTRLNSSHSSVSRMPSSA